MKRTSFYCQLDYEDVPYLSPLGTPFGTIANNGCGVCCCSMIAENLAGISLPPEKCARLAKASGGREGYGTRLFTFAPYFAQYAGLDYSVTKDSGEAFRFLRETGGMAIANIRGDRKDDGYIGVFSNACHYVVLAGIEGSTVKVWDPMFRTGSGRYDKPGRTGKVRLDGTDAYADMSVIAEDTNGLAYFLFSRASGSTESPLIGVISGGKPNEEEACLQAVRAAGGTPVVLEAGASEDLFTELSERIDGLLVADASAGKAVSLVRAKRKPVLGIGDGIISMASAIGAHVIPGTAVRQEDSAPQTDSVQIERGTQLEAICGSGEISVYAANPLTLEDLPEKVRPAALAENGMLCAFERPGLVLYLGVSWHPEYSSDAAGLSLFSTLVYSARAVKQYLPEPDPEPDPELDPGLDP